MTPKEKAEELVSKYYDIEWLYEGYNIFMPKAKAKECASIAVDEILNSGADTQEFYFDKSLGYFISYREYYYEVKQEIENQK